MNCRQPKIDVRIAFEPGARLGEDYNRIMTETVHDWVMIVDHDVLLLNPHWYEIAQQAIKRNPAAGLFSCYTNNLGNSPQRHPSPPHNDASIAEHRAFARQLFDDNGFSCTDVPGRRCSGMLLLIEKHTWKRVGGFPGVGIFREDWQFGGKVERAGIPVKRMDGLYVYHVRDRTVGSWIPGVETTKEIRDRERAK